MDCEFEFLWPEEAIGVEGKLIKALLHEVFARCEVRWMSWQWRKREKGVFGDATNSAKLFGEHCGNWSDFLVDCLVLEYKDGRVGGWKWWKSMQCSSILRDGRRRGVTEDGEHLNGCRTSNARIHREKNPLR